MPCGIRASPRLGTATQPRSPTAGVLPERPQQTSGDAAETIDIAEDDPRPSPWCCPSLHYTHLVNQQMLVALLLDGKDRPTVRQKKRLELGRKGCGDELSWPLFTGTQVDKLGTLVTDRLVQRNAG